MPRAFTTFQEWPKHFEYVTIEDPDSPNGTIYQVSFTWRERTSSWYMDLALQDGTEIVRSRRLSPSWAPMAGITVERAPGGLIYVRGPDTVTQEALGNTLIPFLFSLSERPEPPTQENAPSIVKL